MSCEDERVWVEQRRSWLIKALLNQAKKVRLLQQKVGSLAMWNEHYITENHRIVEENKRLRGMIEKIQELTKWEGSMIKP